MNSTLDAAVEVVGEFLAPASGNRAAGLGRVATVVASHIEPVTRFNARDLQESEPERAFGVGLGLTLKQTVAFNPSVERGPAYLAKGVTNCGSKEAFSAEMQKAMDRAHRESDQAMRAWVEKAPGSYRRLMSEPASFLREPGKYGYEHRCTTCHGVCKVTCSTCAGEGDLRCSRCGGAGKCNCSSCRGTTHVDCGHCRGQGHTTERRYTQEWDEYKNCWRTKSEEVRSRCGSCGGSGKAKCHHCGFDGKVQCNGGCRGKGRIPCGPCNQTGKLDCGACRASGVQHVAGTIQSKVLHDEVLKVGSDSDELSGLVREHVPREDLPALGALLDVSHSFSPNGMETLHRLRLDVTQASVMANERTFVIHAFGPKHTVFNFKEIAGHMLDGDLKALETKVAESSRWKRQRGSALLDSTADFLRSELNMQIAERLTDSQVGSEGLANREVAAHFKGLVGPLYVERTTKALHGALGKLYGAELMEPAVYLCGLSGLLAALLLHLSWPLPGAWAAGSVSLVFALAAWGVLEFQTRRRIERRFDPALARRVLQQISASGGTMRWRMGLAGGASITIAAVLAATQRLPDVKNYFASTPSQELATSIIDQWEKQPVVDFQLRTYPAHSLLEVRAEAGDQRAIQILAWRHLLGAGGQKKDVLAAARWLDYARAEPSENMLLQSARAVLVLNQESTPKSIRAAARDLGVVAEQGLVEARYWEARIFLAPQSPVHDLKAGLARMTEAADRGHAHAALAIGTRHASGEGVQRDIAKARAYLLQAANQGLPDANAALAAL